MSRTDRITRFDFVLLAGEDEFDLAGADPAALFVRWTGDDPPQGGPYVDIEDAPWTARATAADLWMTVDWFRAAQALSEGATSFGAWKDGERECQGPWDESGLCWRREGPLLVMEDLAPVQRRRLVGKALRPGGVRSVRVDYADWMTNLATHAGRLSTTLRAVRDLGVAKVKEFERDPTRKAPYHHLVENDLPRPEDLAVLDAVAAWKRP